MVFPLAACLEVGPETESIGFLSPSETTKALSKSPLAKVPLYNGRVVVAGPKGYCADGGAISRGAQGSVVLIAGCDVLSGKAGASVAPAVMTVSVSPRRLTAEQPTASDLATSLTPGKVLASEDGDGISLVRLSSGGDAVLSGGEPRYWRAAMLINGHIVSLAAYTPKGSGTSGKALIVALAENLREFSPTKDFTPASETIPTATAE